MAGLPSGLSGRALRAQVRIQLAIFVFFSVRMERSILSIREVGGKGLKLSSGDILTWPSVTVNLSNSIVKLRKWNPSGFCRCFLFTCTCRPDEVEANKFGQTSEGRRKEKWCPYFSIRSRFLLWCSSKRFQCVSKLHKKTLFLLRIFFPLLYYISCRFISVENLPFFILFFCA